MNGATADPSVSTIRNPKSPKNKIIGASHHFFRLLIKSHNSKSILSFDITYLSYLILWIETRLLQVY